MTSYQFRIDGRPAGPWRRTWREAAQDDVSQGYAVWSGAGTALDDQGEIYRLCVN